MRDFEAFEETHRGMIKRGSRYGNKIYMYPDHTGFIVNKNGRTRKARRDELVGYSSWIPVEDEFDRKWGYI